MTFFFLFLPLSVQALSILFFNISKFNGLRLQARFNLLVAQTFKLNSLNALKNFKYHEPKIMNQRAIANVKKNFYAGANITIMLWQHLLCKFKILKINISL